MEIDDDEAIAFVVPPGILNSKKNERKTGFLKMFFFVCSYL
jgi:hypothetical protein